MDTPTAEQLAFLARPLHGFLPPAAGSQPPEPRPVWFEATAASCSSARGPAALRWPVEHGSPSCPPSPKHVPRRTEDRT